MSKPSPIDLELQSLEESNGLLRAVDVVNWASEHPDSALHKSLEWNDSVASHQYRLEQARRIIRVRVVMIEGKSTRRYVSVGTQREQEDGGYLTTTTVLDSPALRQQMLAECKQELNRIRRKFAHLTELSRIWDEVDNL